MEFEKKEKENLSKEISDRLIELGSQSEDPAELCHHCGEELCPEYVALYEDEKISRLKHLLDSQETGEEITYRCIRCRNCLDCKNAEKVDKISLREEAELY